MSELKDEYLTSTEHISGLGGSSSMKSMHGDNNGIVYIGGKFQEGSVPGTKNILNMILLPKLLHLSVVILLLLPEKSHKHMMLQAVKQVTMLELG